ncbi:calcium-binding protein [Cellulomonas sp. S1-8]|uniref:calcium-binding protein n=1 Tax=Cellulomonas sp. S1-8 TaxID=2904790 RepID=UPI002243E9F8|nr:calcium-binding protein [Cellulomonas sp. S1-8]UZN03663.1 hypothetical protein OKX07_01595 [Cellulomonas sp. S1-8]
MRRTRLGLTVATVLAATLLLPAPAWAGDVQRQEFRWAPSDPWQVRGFSGEPVASTRGGAITIGEETLVMLLEYETPADWTGSANRLTGWDVDFRMRLGSDTTKGCLDEQTGTPATLLWVGDTTDLMHLGFGVDGLCILYPYADREVVPLDTSRMHRYHLEARGQQVRLTVDGRTVIDKTFAGTGGGTVALGFETYQGTSTWDYVRYDTAPGRPCTIRGTDGPDDLVGTRRADVICAGDGDDRVRGLGGDDVLIGGEGDDTLLGGDGHDLLQGGWGDDVLDNGRDSGRAEGGQGDDRFVTGAAPDGAHQLVGGPGHDVADYSARTAPVTVTLDALGGDGAPGEGDSVGAPAPWASWHDIEEVRGGHGDDVLTGSRWEDTLVGGPGADLLQGLDGSDALRGADGVEGNDRLDGGAAADACTADPSDELVSCNEPDPTPTFTMPPPPPTPTPTGTRGPTPSPTGSPTPPMPTPTGSRGPTPPTSPSPTTPPMPPTPTPTGSRGPMLPTPTGAPTGDGQVADPFLEVHDGSRTD